MNISEQGLVLIKSFEGLRLQAYQCCGGVWTIGYGHTAGVSPGDKITAEEADCLLRMDVRNAEYCVSKEVTVSLNQYQFDALISFVFNLGNDNFRNSTLLKKLNAGDDDCAAEELLRWVNAGGSKQPGLVRRRMAEKALFSG